MNRRITVAVATAAAFGLAATGSVGTAAAAAKKNQIKILGGFQVKLGQYVKDNQRFQSPKGKVKSGSTVKVVNKAKTQEPHTISFTEKQFLPGTDLETPVDDQLLAAHQVDPTNEEAPPGVFVVDNGVAVPPGGTLEVDTPFTPTSAGDSAFIAPGQNFSFKVTADPGSTLYFFCGIHPWMQGKIRVK